MRLTPDIALGWGPRKRHWSAAPAAPPGPFQAGSPWHSGQEKKKSFPGAGFLQEALGAADGRSNCAWGKRGALSWRGEQQLVCHSNKSQPPLLAPWGRQRGEKA